MENNGLKQFDDRTWPVGGNRGKELAKGSNG